MKGRVAAVRNGLLELHKALLDAERSKYEQVHGRVTSSKMLQLAFSDAQFAWLRSLSELIVRIDELLEARAAGDSDFEGLMATVRALLTASGQSTPFAREYDAAMRGDQHIAVLHGRVMQALSQ